MSHQPPIPEASQSPYPIKEPPHHPVADAGDDGRKAGDDEGGSLETFADRLDDIGLDTKAAIGIGAAVGLGAIAGIAALLFSAFGKREPESAAASAAKKPAPRAKATKPAAGAKPARKAAAKPAAKPASKPAARKAAPKADNAG